MFNTNVYRAGDTNLSVNTPASGLLVKTHELSKIKITKKDSYMLTDGYTQKHFQYGGEMFKEVDKCTVLQVMPYTQELLLVEYVLNVDLEKVRKNEQ